MIRLWVHTGQGVWIGSVCVVAAKTKEEAESIIRTRLDDSSLDEELNIEEHVLKKDGPIIHFDDGDY